MFAKYRIRQVYLKKCFTRKRRYYKAQKRVLLFLWDDMSFEIRNNIDSPIKYVETITYFTDVSECSQELQKYIEQNTDDPKPQTVMEFDKKGKRL